MAITDSVIDLCSDGGLCSAGIQSGIHSGILQPCWCSVHWHRLQAVYCTHQCLQNTQTHRHAHTDLRNNTARQSAD